MHQDCRKSDVDAADRADLLSQATYLNLIPGMGCVGAALHRASRTAWEVAQGAATEADLRKDLQDSLQEMDSVVGAVSERRLLRTLISEIDEAERQARPKIESASAEQGAANGATCAG